MLEVKSEADLVSPDRCLLVGIGGAGCHVLDRSAAILGGLSRPMLVAVNTDSKTLAASAATKRVQIGATLTRGMGAGGDPEVGRRAAEEDAEHLRELLSGAALVFLVAGLGGGTGSGAAPRVAALAKDAGALTLCFATLPFEFEGRDCASRAAEALAALRETCDVLVVLPNERLMLQDGGETSMKAAFRLADETVASTISAIWRLVSREGLIGLGFLELKRVAQHSRGTCAIGFGRGSGPDRAAQAVEEVLNCPMLGRDRLAGAEALLVSIVGGGDVRLREAGAIMSAISQAADREAHVFMGAIAEEEFGEKLTVTVLVAERWEPQAQAAAAAPGGSEADDAAQKASQGDLPLTPADKGRFKDTVPTIHRGEDLDIPAFMRRGISIDK